MRTFSATDAGSIDKGKEKKLNIMGRRPKRKMGYVPPAGGAAHPFREAEKLYKKYNGVETDFSQVIDFRDLDHNTPENRERLIALSGKTFRGNPM